MSGMTVKWVCSDCGSNNIGKKPGILRCEICGKPRTLEALLPVDTTILQEVPEVRVSPAVNGTQLVRFLAVTIVRRASVLLLALLAGSAAATMLAFYRAGMGLSWARVAQNTGLLLGSRFDWALICEPFYSLLRQIGRVRGNVPLLFSLACPLFLQCLLNLRLFLGSIWGRLGQLADRMLRNIPLMRGGLPRFLQDLRALAHFLWENVRRLFHSGTAQLHQLLDKIIP